jgi:predicted pyridoxine 5'-phosphate oxidase superfamily flavin-nucleotide-binding protein
MRELVYMVNLSKFRKLIEGKIVYLATADPNSKPNLITCEGNRVLKDTIVITDNMMGKTRRNLLKNRKVAVVCGSGDKWYQLKGVASYHPTGKWLKFVQGLPANGGYDPKGAVLVKVKEGYDLNSKKRLF